MDKNSVLIVDDEPLNINMLVHILRSEYICYIARNGDDAIEVANKSLPDIILLDIIMPKMDGYEVLSHLKASDNTKDIPVIFITGLKDSKNEEKALQIGASDYINKPFAESVVKLRVRQHLQITNQLRTIEKLNENLRSALEYAESANQAKSTFLAQMSHEIRSPMNAILGITEILMRDNMVAEESMEGLHKIYNSGDLLMGIINDILDLSKIESGNLEIVNESYDTASLISDAVQLNMIRFDNCPVGFELEIAKNVPAKAEGDALRIKQILNNLLSNGAKYTKEGKVVLEVNAKGSEIIFVVRDTGMGMSEQQVSMLFEPYTRFHDNNGRTIEGVGLGMGITRRLIEMMDGSIKVESKLGEGTTFTVAIPQKFGKKPLSAEVIKNLQHFRMDSASKLKNRQTVHELMQYGSVLVVDDMETNLYVAKGLLMPYGLKVETAESGQEAIDKVKEGKEYDIIFMDLLMPGIDGANAVTQIRELGYKHPVVALTANVMEVKMNIYLESGFDAILSKPIDTRQLDTLLKKLIRDKPLRLDILMIESFANDADRAIAAMENLMAAGENYTESDLQAYILNAHGLVGILSNVRENELQMQAREFEKAGSIEDMHFIFSETPAFLEALRKVVNKLEPTVEIDRSVEGLHSKLMAIKSACEASDSKEAEKILDEIKSQTTSSQTKMQLVLMRGHLLRENYKEAANTAVKYANTL